MSPYKNIVAILSDLGIPYEELKHPEVAGCDDSQEYRRRAGWDGASSKCIVFHARGHFYMVVTCAQYTIKARRFKKQFGTKNYSGPRK